MKPKTHKQAKELNLICPKCGANWESIYYQDDNYVCLNIIGKNQFTEYGYFEKCWHHFEKANKTGRPAGRYPKAYICKKEGCGLPNLEGSGYCLEHRREYQREMNKRNYARHKDDPDFKERIRQSSKEYYRKHPEQKKKKNEAYRLKHPIIIRKTKDNHIQKYTMKKIVKATEQNNED